MRLRDRRSRQPLVPIIVVAIGAAEIELSLPLHEQLASLGEERFEVGGGGGRDRNGARLARDQGGKRQQTAALVRKRRRLLMVDAAQIDALLQIDGAAERLVERGIAGSDALHGRAGLAVAVGAGLVGGAYLALPQRIAVEHPEHAGIGGVVLLHRLGVRGQEAVCGGALALRDIRGANSAGRQQGSKGYDPGKSHSTVIEAEAVSEKPLSPIHSNSNFPLSVAVVKTGMKGLATVAGKRSARKISGP